MDNIFKDFYDPYTNKSWATLPGRYTQNNDHIHLELTYPHQLHSQHLRQALLEHLANQGHHTTHVTLSSTIPSHRPQAQLTALSNVKNIVGISANKGGVGKSTIATNIAIALHQAGARVGLVDTDLYGPNQPQLLGIDEPAAIANEHYIPIEKHGIHAMSMGLLVDKATPLVWRGPMASAYMQQLITKTQWPALDYLLVDLPPGTGDIQLSLCQKIPLSGVALISTPHKLSLDDCAKANQMLDKMHIAKLGLITNMDGYTCSHCHQHNTIFTEDVAAWATQHNLPHLGSIPLDQDLAHSQTLGAPLVTQQHPLQERFRRIAVSLAATLSERPVAQRSKFPRIVVES